VSHIIDAVFRCLHRSVNREFEAEVQEIITNEKILLQTLGFQESVEYPHQHIVRCFSLFRGRDWVPRWRQCASIDKLARKRD
jgi:hypothetical protein